MRKSLLILAVLCLGPSLFGGEPGPEDLIEAGHWKRLRSVAAERVAANPGDAQALYLLGYAKLSLRDLAAAETHVTKAVSLNGNNADYRFLLGHILGQKASGVGIFEGMGLIRKFRKENDAALKLDPNHLPSLLDLMEFYQGAPAIAGGDTKKAAETAERIGKVDPARGFMAQASLASGEKKVDWSAVETLERKAVEADPRSYRALMMLANLYASDPFKRYDDAEALCRKALKLDAGRGSAYSLLAILSVRRERPADLDAILAQAEKSVPDDLGSHYQAAKALLVAGKDLPRAEGYLRKYLALEAEGEAPSHAAAHWRLGLVLEKQGRKPDAVREIEESLRLQPDFKPAREDLKRLKG